MLVGLTAVGGFRRKRKPVSRACKRRGPIGLGIVHKGEDAHVDALSTFFLVLCRAYFSAGIRIENCVLGSSDRRSQQRILFHWTWENDCIDLQKMSNVDE